MVLSLSMLTSVAFSQNTKHVNIYFFFWKLINFHITRTKIFKLCHCFRWKGYLRNNLSQFFGHFHFLLFSIIIQKDASFIKETTQVLRMYCIQKQCKISVYLETTYVLDTACFLNVRGSADFVYDCIVVGYVYLLSVTNKYRYLHPLNI